MKLNIKDLISTKTFWLGIVTIGFGITQIAHGNTDSGIQSIALGLGMITGRDAISKISKT